MSTQVALVMNVRDYNRESYQKLKQMAVIVNQKNRTKLRKALVKNGAVLTNSFITTQTVNEILQILREGEKLQAVKMVWDLVPLGLKESKQLVDNLTLEYD